jgi:hypothetical protein
MRSENRIPLEQYKTLQKEKREALGKELEAKSSINIRIQTMLEIGLQFHEKIWDEDEKFWAEVEKNPTRFKARFASFSLFFSKFAPPRLNQPQESDGRSRMTPDKLQELELSSDQIRKLAELDGESEDKDAS